MAGCEYLFNPRRLNLRRRASHSTVVIALIGLFLTATGVWAWGHAASGRSIPTVSAEGPAPTPALNAPSAPPSDLISLAGQEFPASDGVSGVVVGEFEGYFDATSRSFTTQPRKAPGAESRKDRRQNFRSDPSSDIPQGSGFGLIVINSAFISTGDNPGTVSGEVAIFNNTTATLYNTRLVFTSFRICPASGACNNSTSTGDASNLPGATGLAYFNDGQVAYSDKLHVSRSYGDISAGGNVKNIWTFATVAQPPRFFFTYKVIADLGVAAESVQPAAVQVNAASGTSVVINGRGFTGTPMVELLPAAGSPIAMTNVSATATQITATVPASTAAGVYSVRVTNPGGVAGGQGSSALLRKLTVTGAPSGGNILSGAISSFAGAGPFLISSNATIVAGVVIPAGVVIYVSNGVTITVASGGNITANGGIPGISSTNPAQIVFTAQRSPGATMAPVGSWGGINATSASTATMIMRNVVVEFGGTVANAAINLNGSGRTLRFTDSVVRASGGSGISANGQNDSLISFARNRVDSNGGLSSSPAVLLSGNAALGLFDIDTSAGGTSVGDASYYYSSANEFDNNQVNAIQIGTDADVASNDFTKSGVLVGQGSTPIRIRGNCGNPAIVGAAPPAAPAELTITATAIIQLAAEMAFQAGDYATGKVGCIAANGYAGAYLGAQAATSNKLIQFDKIPGGANFGAIFFTRNAMANCILNYTKVQNGGNGANCGLGAGEVLAEAVSVKVTNSQITDSSTGGLLATVGAKVDTKGTTFSATTPIIDTVAGGVLGDGNLGVKANMVTPVVAALDPLGRGIFIVDFPSGTSLLRFLNTTRNTVTIAGRKIPASVITTLAGGGYDLSDNIPARAADIGTVTGVGVSSNGEIVYFIDASGPAVRLFNASGATKAIDGVNVGSGNVGTLFSGGDFGSALNGLAVHPTTGDIYVADATPGGNKVYRIPANGSADPDVEVGNGAATKAGDPFSPGDATQIPLLQPRALTFDPSGNLYVADTGHGRVIKVDPNGVASLMAQFAADRNTSVPPYVNPPHPSGLAFFNGKLYIANGNAQDILQVNSPGNVSTVAGTTDKQNPVSCDYSSSNCGDGGPAADANFSLIGSTGTPPLAGIAADSKGIFVLDQGVIQRGRVRYINLSQAPAEIAGVVVAAGVIETVAGSGLEGPFDGGLATSAAFNGPTGVAMDPNGNLWISDTLSSKLRFVNCGAAPFTIFAGTPSEQVVPPGSIVTVNKDVGAGQTDGVPVIMAGFDTPQGLWATAEGVYVADSKRGGASGNRRTGLVRFINISNKPVQFYSGAALISVAPGEIKTIAGGGLDSGLGDTSGPGVGAPLLAKFLAPEDVAVAANGDIYIADAGQQRVRKVARSNGNVSSVIIGAANVNQYTGLSFDSAGRLLVADAEANAILRASNASNTSFNTIISGGLLKRPRDVAQGTDGALYVTNPGDVSPISAQNQKLLKITLNGSTGEASIFSGSITGYSGDGGPAANALLNVTPANINIATIGTAATIRATVNIFVTSSGEIIFADSGNNAIRRIR